MKCVRVEIRRMRATRDRLGCDHRAVFATTYLELTKELRDRLRADPRLLRWKKFFFREDALFAERVLPQPEAMGAGQVGAGGVADRVRDRAQPAR